MIKIRKTQTHTINTTYSHFFLSNAKGTTNAMNFAQQQRKLVAALHQSQSKAAASLRQKGFDGFLGGGVSGIQDFIFSVPSKGAAKKLKARSYFIQLINKVCVQKIKDCLAENAIEELYVGGGNFYLYFKYKDVAQIKKLQQEIADALIDEDIYVTLSWVKINAEGYKDFSKVWTAVHKKTAEDKLRQFSTNYDAFKPMPVSKSVHEWANFTKAFTQHNGYTLEKTATNSLVVQKDSIKVLGYEAKLTKNKQGQFKGKVLNELPIWTKALKDKHQDFVEKHNKSIAEKIALGTSKTDLNTNKIVAYNIVEFNHLAYFAKIRTGTEKLAILKMDIDDLGKTIGSISNPTASRALSQSLKWFFEDYMLELLKRSYEYHTLVLDDAGNPIVLEEQTNKRKHKKYKKYTSAHALYQDNIYVVFSGGDDCFLLGAWDALFDFAILIDDEFEKFTKHQLHLSAGLIVVDAHFPVVRFAEIAEDATRDAKNYLEKKKDVPRKNKISVFGEVLSWDEFKDAQKKAKFLQKLIIAYDEPRSILDRIKKSAIGFERLQERIAEQSTLPAPKVWRFFYYIRNSKNPEHMKDFVNGYATDLMKAIATNEITNPMKYPIAARWAEFLTRKKRNDE